MSIHDLSFLRMEPLTTFSPSLILERDRSRTAGELDAELDTSRLASPMSSGSMGSGALGGMNPAVCPGDAAAAPPGGGGGGRMLSATISGERSNDTVGDVVRSFGGGVLGEEGDAGTGCRMDAARLSGETG